MNDERMGRRPRAFSRENLWDDVTNVVSAQRGLSDWAVTWRQHETWQIYLVGHETESVRVVRNEQATVDIHVDHDGMRGSASLSFLPGDHERIVPDLAAAIDHARLAGNPVWPLPGLGQDYPEAPVADLDIMHEPRHVLLDVRDHALLAVADEPSCSLSSLEVYLSRGERRLQNSRGILGVYPETTAFLDVVMLAKHGDAVAESHLDRDARGVDLLDVTGAIVHQAEMARDGLRVQLPRTHRGPVILGQAALQNFFNPLLAQASAQAAYQKMSRLDLGAPIWGEGEARGEPLELVSDPTLPMGWRSAPFDHDGLASRRLDLVRGGRLINRWADQRFAHYLGIAPTGRAGNVVVTPGAMELETLRRQGDVVYEVADFSAFAPDEITGDFVAEIKLGYRIDEQGRQPVKGGSVSGNVFTALRHAHFSREIGHERAYLGPAAIWFGDLTISGE